eukprot:978243_1
MWPLYGLSAQPKPSKPTETPSSPTPTPSPLQSQTLFVPTTPTTHRVSMIKFRHGVRGETDNMMINGLSTSQISGMKPLNEDTIPFWELPQELRRRELNEWDIDAVNTSWRCESHRKESIKL